MHHPIHLGTAHGPCPRKRRRPWPMAHGSGPQSTTRANHSGHHSDLNRRRFSHGSGKAPQRTSPAARLAMQLLRYCAWHSTANSRGEAHVGVGQGKPGSNRPRDPTAQGIQPPKGSNRPRDPTAQGIQPPKGSNRPRDPTAQGIQPPKGSNRPRDPTGQGRGTLVSPPPQWPQNTAYQSNGPHGSASASAAAAAAAREKGTAGGESGSDSTPSMRGKAALQPGQGQGPGPGGTPSMSQTRARARATTSVLAIGLCLSGKTGKNAR
jgi:hypothetical protein